MDLELEPKGIQSTISIKASGEVVVQFGNMRHPPFDTDEARNELRLALNEMDGVDIPAGKLRYLAQVPDLGARRAGEPGATCRGSGSSRGREPCRRH